MYTVSRTSDIPGRGTTVTFRHTSHPWYEVVLDEGHLVTVFFKLGGCNYFAFKDVHQYQKGSMEHGTTVMFHGKNGEQYGIMVKKSTEELLKLM